MSRRALFAALCGLFLAPPAFSQNAPESSWHERALFVAGMTKPGPSGLGVFAHGALYAAHAATMDRVWAFEKTNSLDRIIEWRKTELPEGAKGQEVFYPLGGADLPNAMTFFPDAPRYTFIALEPTGQVPDVNAKSQGDIIKGLDGIRQTFSAMCGLNYFESRMLRVSWSNATVNGNLPLFLSFIVRFGGEVTSVKFFTLDSAGKKVYSTEAGKPGVEIEWKQDGQAKALEYHQMYLDDKLLTNNTPEGVYLKNRPKGVTLLKAAVYLYFWPNEVLFKNLTLEKSSTVLQDDSGIPFSSFATNLWSPGLYGTYSKPGPVGGIGDVPHQKDLEAAYAKAGKNTSLTFNYGYGILWGGKHRANLMLFKKKE